VRNISILVFTVAVLIAAPIAPSAVASNKPAKPTSTREQKTAPPLRGSVGDLIPLSASTFASRDEATLGLPTVRSERGGLVRFQPGGPGPESRLLQDAAAAEPRKHKYLPVLFSLLVPGTGEIYLGYYWRGAALVTAEVIAWTGYAMNKNEGLETREQYEAFADAHWSYDKWIFDHRTVRDLPEDERTFDRLYEIGETTWDDWPGFHSWHSKEEEKQNYYENIGKYDWFISGWEDWQWDDVGNPDDPPRDTALRDEYRAMRNKSNDQLDDAQKFIYLSVAARVFSLVETYLLVRKEDRGEKPTEGQKLSIGARATGLRSGKVELKLKW